jgi:hypothetical protein
MNSGADDDDQIAQQIQDAEAKAPEDLTEEDKMVLLGRPKNGDVIRAQLRIKESKEFKVSRENISNIFFLPLRLFMPFEEKENE